VWRAFDEYLTFEATAKRLASMRRGGIPDFEQPYLAAIPKCKFLVVAIGT